MTGGGGHTVTVHTPTCPKDPDGRPRHYFVKVDGEFVCQNCGHVSQPGQRWDRRRKKA